MQQKLLDNQFNLEDFLGTMKQMRNMGPLQKIVEMMPGLPGIGKINADELDENEVAHVEAIILSMTPDERRNPKVIDGKRKRRIARGAGMTTADVNEVLNQFQMVRKMVRTVKTGRGGKRRAKIDLSALRGLPTR